MALFDNFTDKVTKTAKSAAKKSGELIEITRLNIAIGLEEDKISKAYSEIGKLIYESFDNIDNVPENIKPYFIKIISYTKAVQEFRQKILELKNARVCSSCGEEIVKGCLYCPKCGHKQEEIICNTEQNALKVCPECLKDIDLDVLYCPFCGTKI